MTYYSEQARTRRDNDRKAKDLDQLNKLSAFLEALDEWGCVDNQDRAKEILEFQKGGYDLSAYREEHDRD